MNEYKYKSLQDYFNKMQSVSDVLITLSDTVAININSITGIGSYTITEGTDMSNRPQVFTYYMWTIIHGLYSKI